MSDVVARICGHHDETSGHYASRAIIDGVVSRCVVEVSSFGGVWWVNRAIVADAPRGAGIGSTLLRATIDHLREIGAENVRVTPGGYDGNEEQQCRFYEKNGFVHRDGYMELVFER